MVKSSLRNKIFIIGAVVLVTLGSFFIVKPSPGKIALISGLTEIPANGVSAAHYRIVRKNAFWQWIYPYQKGYQIEFLTGKDLVEHIGDGQAFYLKGGVFPGKVQFKIIADGNELSSSLVLMEDSEDGDGDGYPDVLELQGQGDREAFTEWFTAIAESQYYRISDAWATVHQDCSGLIFFAFREALKKHDEAWFKKFRYLAAHQSPDVEKYHYPNLPLVGDKPFRVKPGRFEKEDLTAGGFAPIANASSLLNYSMTFVGKDTALLQKGDVLFFLQEDAQQMPYHSMIYSGESAYLIYHTGPMTGKKRGEVRKVKLQDLMNHPDSRWRPSSDNPAFLGVYRWKILS